MTCGTTIVLGAVLLGLVAGDARGLGIPSPQIINILSVPSPYNIMSALPSVALPDIAPHDIPGAGVVESVVNSTMNTVAPGQVCFGYLGCFSMSMPWWSPLRPLPAPMTPEEIQTRFYLYTRRSPGRWVVKTQPEVSVEGSDYDGSKTTFIITHGFSNDGNATWMSEMKDAILGKLDANVILVDWGKGASLLNYFQVASNTRVVGAEIARLAKHLIRNGAWDPRRFHLIGHSLGAQISSYVGKRIPNVGQITALDPAQPAFEGFDKAVRLDESDAMFVQVLHTSSRPFIPFIGLGMIQQYGHVDFYMNGGWSQPGCILPPMPEIKSFLDLATVPVEVLANFIACPHGRAYEFLTASVLNDNCTFWGHQSGVVENIASTLTAGHLARALFPDNNCTATTCSPLGLEAINYPARGVFDVATTQSKPFCVSEPVVDANMRQYRRKLK